MAHQFRYILKFDDDEGTLREGEGIPAGQIAELVEALIKAVQPSKSEKIVLQDIVHESYGVALSMREESTLEHLKVIHRKISRSETSSFSQNELSYAAKLKVVMGGKYHLKAFEQGGRADEIAEVREIALPTAPRFYFEQSTIQGSIISIGSTTEDGIPHIRVADYPQQIEVSFEQDRQLATFYRTKKLRFLILKKIDLASGEIKKTKLEDFEILTNDNFAKAISKFREEKPEGFFSEIEETAAFVRELRTTTF